MMNVDFECPPYIQRHFCMPHDIKQEENDDPRQSPYIEVAHFYGTEYEIWGRLAILKKKLGRL